jgi:uncharacterized tellurite resistance protein B-like protein
MEGILGIGAIILFFVVVRFAFRALTGTVSAASRAASGRGSFKDNLQVEFKGLGNFQIKLIKTPAGSEIPFDIVEVMVKGLFPVTSRRNLAFVTSVIDVTEDKTLPVLSMVEGFQEADTTAYQHRVQAGMVEPDTGFLSWIRAGAVVPEMLVPPYGGERKLKIVLRLVDEDMVNHINMGLHTADDRAIVGLYTTSIVHKFEGKGYEETVADRDRSNALVVRLAVAVAMADGSMDKTEAQTISAWIAKTLSILDGDRRVRVKEASNAAFKEAYAEAKKSELTLSHVTADLNALADEATKYQAIELCLDVMAADGNADPSEIETIRRIAMALDIDFDELQKMKDQRLVKLTQTASGDSLEALLGIDPDWTADRIKKHLRVEFAKWNGRLTSLTDPSERERAQDMLDLIADARKKHA